MKSSRDSSAASIGFIVGEIPCSPFIATLVNGISQTRVVYVFGADEGTGDDGFAQDVVVEKWPRSSAKRCLYLLMGLIRMSKSGLGGYSRLWKYSTRKGWQSTLGRMLQGVPLLIHRPDLIHVQWAKALHRVMEMRELYDFPIVLSLRGPHITSSPLGDPQLRRQYEMDFPKVNGFHAVCCSIKDDAVKLGASSERVSVAYSGADEDLVALPLVPLRENPVPLRILSVGRIHWMKGYHWALDAMAELKDSHDFEYRIVAGGASEELQWQISELGLENSVIFEPRMSRDEVLREMRHSADVLLVPSVGEGIANVAIEAMAVGLPVIATRCGGMPELISNGETGLLCDVWTSGSMAGALRAFAEMDLESCERLRQQAREFIRRDRTVKALFAQMSDLYGRVTSEEIEIGS